MAKNYLMWAVFSLCSAPGLISGQANPMVTDRPDFTESTVVVPPGSVQLEAGVTRTAASGGDGAVVSGPELLVRIGVARIAELRLGAPTWTRSGGPAPRGAWDHRWSLGTKVQVLRGGRTGVVILGGATVTVGGGEDLPASQVTASSASDDREASYALQVAVSREVGRLSLAAMTSVVAGTETRTGQTVVASTPVARAGAIFVEYSGTYGGGRAAEHLGHVGAVWQLSPELQVDLHGGHALRGESTTFVGIGISAVLP